MIYRCKAAIVKIIIDTKKAHLPQHVDCTVTHSVQLMVLRWGIPDKANHHSPGEVGELLKPDIPMYKEGKT